MKITVAGAGYVGLSLAVLLSQQHDVTILDVQSEKVRLIQQKKAPIRDELIQQYLKEKDLRLTATSDSKQAYSGADWVIAAVPTDYNDETHEFDTRAVEQVAAMREKWCPQAVLVVKSTVPVGYTASLIQKTGNSRTLFSPEFLRESKALYDNLHPSRIVVGSNPEEKENAEKFAGLLKSASLDPDTSVQIIGLNEAEAVKLFANTYLALRVSYFNELDTFCAIKGLDTREIIQGVCADKRIGSFYNNPSFGYGGYCLPKDTKQLLHNYRDVPENLIQAIVDSNRTRKDFIARDILNKARVNPDHPEKTRIGIYRLTMKTKSDNFRHSSIQGILKRLAKTGVQIQIYEPMMKQESFAGYPVVNNWEQFRDTSDLIVANRMEPQLKQAQDKVYTRDLFGRD